MQAASPSHKEERDKLNRLKQLFDKTQAVGWEKWPRETGIFYKVVQGKIASF